MPGDIRVRQHAQPVPACPPRRREAAAAPHQRRPASVLRRRRHVDVAVPSTTALAGRATRVAAPASRRQACRGSRMSSPKCSNSSGRYPRAEDVGRPALADDVEHGHVLGEADRVVERQNQDQAQRQALGAGRDRRGENQRRRKVAVFGSVVFAQHRGQCSRGSPPRRTSRRRGVQLPPSGRRTPVRACRSAACTRRLPSSISALWLF